MTTAQVKNTNTSNNKGLNPKGFTLIELLVVIAIIAILAVIGLTVFSGQQRAARDGRRKSDIQSLSAAMEANYNTLTGLYPGVDQANGLASASFTAQVVPQDPVTGQMSCGGLNGAGAIQCDYCWQGVVNAVNCGAVPAYVNIANSAGGFPATAQSAYTFCAYLENVVAPYCLSSQR